MTHRSSDVVLGVMRGPDALYAVLVERTDDGPVVQFAFPPTLTTEEREESPPQTEDFVNLEGGLTDVTIQFGDPAEEGGRGEEAFGDGDAYGPASGAAPDFRRALDGILHQCRERGYEDPTIAFCAPYSETEHIELTLPAESGLDDEAPVDFDTVEASRETLLALLEKRREGEVDAERVGFLPMSRGDDGGRRVLAVVSRHGSVQATIQSMPDSGLFRASPVQLLETEVSLYYGWARTVVGAASSEEKSLVVRVGSEDTLLLFMEGEVLQQVDTLPSLTVDDPADTICSRVLLYQDEYGMGDVENIFLVGERRGDQLLEGFEPYFSKTQIHLLREKIGHRAEDPQAGLYEAAIGAAFRQLAGANEVFGVSSLNLIGSTRQRTYGGSSVGGWQGVLILAVMLLTVGGLGWYGMDNAQEIRERRAQLDSLERTLDRANRARLQATVDSLEALVDRRARASTVRKKLLRGSNKWSRSLADVSSLAAEVKGVSIRDYRPRDTATVELSGYATARPRIVALAEGLDAEITGVTFTDIRDRRLYGFALSVPLDTTRPAAISYWQNERSRLTTRTDSGQIVHDSSGVASLSPASGLDPVPGRRTEGRPSASGQGGASAGRSGPASEGTDPGPRGSLQFSDFVPSHRP